MIAAENNSTDFESFKLLIQVGMDVNAMNPAR